MSGTATLVAVRDAELSGPEVRRATRRATAARADTTLFARLSDAWGNLVSVAIGVGVLAGWVASLRDRISLGGAPVTATTLPVDLTAAVAGVVAAAAGVVVLDRLGPVSSTPAAGAWWLPLPAGRRGLLAGELRRVATAVVLVAAVLAVPLSAGLAASPTPGSVLTAVGLTVGCAAAVVGAVALNQTRGGSGRLAPVAGLVAVAAAAAAAVLGTVAAAGGPAPPSPPALPVAAAAVVALASVPLLAAALAGLDRLGGGQLRTLGATSQYAAASAVTLDTRELGRALAARVRRAPRRPRRFARVRTGATAVVAADATALLRARWQAGQLAVAVAVPVLVARTEGLGALPWAVWLGCVVGWATAAVAAGHPSRLAHVVPAVDRLLPVSATTVVLARAVVPLVLLTAVTGLTGALVAVGSGAPLQWTAMCLATAPAWAAAALRGAFRPEPDWSGPVVSTPMGVVPAGVGLGLVAGIDAGVVGSLPLAVALLLGTAGPGLVALQLVWALAVGAAAVGWVVHRRNRRS